MWIKISSSQVYTRSSGIWTAISYFPVYIPFFRNIYFTYPFSRIWSFSIPPYLLVYSPWFRNMDHNIFPFSGIHPLLYGYGLQYLLIFRYILPSSRYGPISGINPFPEGYGFFNIFQGLGLSPFFTAKYFFFNFICQRNRELSVKTGLKRLKKRIKVINTLFETKIKAYIAHNNVNKKQSGFPPNKI